MISALFHRKAAGRAAANSEPRKTAATAGDVALAFVLSAVVVKGRQSCEGGGLFAADTAQLQHADDDRKRGALTEIGNATLRLAQDPEVEAALVITDGCEDFPGDPMPYHVLWALTPDGLAEFQPSYGAVIRLTR